MLCAIMCNAFESKIVRPGNFLAGFGAKVQLLQVD